MSVGVAAEHGVVPALHTDGRVRLASDPQPLAGDELEEHLLVGGAAEAAIRKGNGVLPPSPLALAALRRRSASADDARRRRRSRAAPRIAGPQRRLSHPPDSRALPYRART